MNMDKKQKFNEIVSIIIGTEETFIFNGEPSHQGLLEAKAEAYDKIRGIL